MRRRGIDKKGLYLANYPPPHQCPLLLPFVVYDGGCGGPRVAYVVRNNVTLSRKPRGGKKTRLTALRDRLAALVRKLQIGGIMRRLIALRDRLTALRDRLAALRDRLAALRDRLAVLEDRWAALRDRISALRDRWAALEDRWAALRDRLSVLKVPEG